MFKPMDPTLLCQLVQDQPDVLAEAIKADDAFYHNLSCPVCSSQGASKRFEAPKVLETEDGTVMLRTPFGNGMLPTGYAKCDSCGTEFDPYTRVIRNTEASLIASPQSDPLPM
jgi:hypothetical protein